MIRSIHALLIAGLFTAVNGTVEARADLAGHWEGVLQAPEMMIDFQIDIARAESGGYMGTISLPGERLHGLPLKVVTLDGRSVNFNARSDQTFAGTLSEDGNSMTGEFTMQGGSAPFRLTRSGDAKIEAPPTSPKISERLAGTWNAAISTRQGGVSVVLKLSNTAEGRSTGILINLHDGGIELPLAIEETANGVTLRTTPIDSSFSGTLSADAMVLDGTFRQGTQSIPVTFRKAQN
jgi:uncharacterized protein